MRTLILPTMCLLAAVIMAVRFYSRYRARVTTLTSTMFRQCIRGLCQPSPCQRASTTTSTAMTHVTLIHTENLGFTTQQWTCPKCIFRVSLIGLPCVQHIHTALSQEH